MFLKIKKLIKKLIQFYYTWRIKRVAKTFGEGLKVNGKSSVTSNTYLGKM